MRHAQHRGKSLRTDKAGTQDQATPETDSADIPTDSLYSQASIDELLYMLEEEKLAGDLYEAFATLYDVKIFDNIAASEDSHFNALLGQAESLGLDVDAFVFQPAGTFVNEELQSIYDAFLADGSTSLEAALTVGVQIETKDITDISEAAENVVGTPLEDVYENLLAGSEYHLAAFENLLV